MNLVAIKAYKDRVFNEVTVIYNMKHPNILSFIEW